MRHGSLFSGIGGFDLAAHWMGWDNIFHCEWNEFGQKVLKHHFPTSKSYNDITKTDFSVHRGEIDILTGGFPCQPYSMAGKRLGKADERHLFPEMLRAIHEIKPRWIIGENVRGLVSWAGGLVFEEVCSDLEREGYEVQPFLIQAASVNAPHQRQRIWFVAQSTSTSNGANEYRSVRQENAKIDREGTQTIYNAIGSDGNKGTTSNANSFGQQCREKGEFSKNRTQSNNKQFERCSKLHTRNFQMFPSESAICGGDDGLPKELDGITFSKWRKESLKAYGNAIVPQVAYEFFKTIEKFENSL